MALRTVCVQMERNTPERKVLSESMDQILFQYSVSNKILNVKVEFSCTFPIRVNFFNFWLLFICISLSYLLPYSAEFGKN